MYLLLFIIKYIDVKIVRLAKIPDGFELPKKPIYLGSICLQIPLSYIYTDIGDNKEGTCEISVTNSMLIKDIVITTVLKNNIVME